MGSHLALASEVILWWQPNAGITCNYPLSLKFAEGMNFESTDKLG